MTLSLNPHKVERGIHNTAPVQIPGIRGPFRKSIFKCGIKTAILTTFLQSGHAGPDITNTSSIVRFIPAVARNRYDKISISRVIVFSLF